MIFLPLLSSINASSCKPEFWHGNGNSNGNCNHKGNYNSNRNVQVSGESSQ